jgi:hypothetical protein
MKSPQKMSCASQLLVVFGALVLLNIVFTAISMLSTSLRADQSLMVWSSVVMASSTTYMVDNAVSRVTSEQLVDSGYLFATDAFGNRPKFLAEKTSNGELMVTYASRPNEPIKYKFLPSGNAAALAYNLLTNDYYRNTQQHPGTRMSIRAAPYSSMTATINGNGSAIIWDSRNVEIARLPRLGRVF